VLWNGFLLLRLISVSFITSFGLLISLLLQSRLELCPFAVLDLSGVGAVVFFVLAVVFLSYLTSSPTFLLVVIVGHFGGFPVLGWLFSVSGTASLSATAAICGFFLFVAVALGTCGNKFCLLLFHVVATPTIPIAAELGQGVAVSTTTTGATTYTTAGVVVGVVAKFSHVRVEVALPDGAVLVKGGDVSGRVRVVDENLDLPLRDLDGQVVRQHAGARQRRGWRQQRPRPWLVVRPTCVVACNNIQICHLSKQKSTCALQ
jgi:hypothetical protein